MKTLKELLKGNSNADQQKLDEYEKFLDLIQSLGGCRQTFKANIENGLTVLDMLDALIPNGLGFVNKQPKYKKIEFGNIIYYMHLDVFHVVASRNKDLYTLSELYLLQHSEYVINKKYNTAIKIRHNYESIIDKFCGVK